MKIKTFGESSVNFFYYLFSRQQLFDIKKDEMATLLKVSTSYLCVPILIFLNRLTFLMLTFIYIWVIFETLKNPEDRVTVKISHTAYLVIVVWSYVTYILEFVKRTETLNLVAMSTNQFKDVNCEGPDTYKKIHVLISNFKIFFVCALGILGVAGAANFTEDFRDLYIVLAVAEKKMDEEKFKWFLIVYISAVCYSCFMITCMFGCCNYFTIQFISQMELLNASMRKTLCENFNYKVNFELIDNADYQKMVAAHLRKCLSYHVILKRFILDLNMFIGRPLLIYYYFTILFMATLVYTVLLYFVGHRITTHQLIRPMCSLFGIFIYNTLGHIYASKCTIVNDVWYDLLQENYWYVWNESNKRTYRLALLVALRPTVIRCGETLVVDSKLAIVYLNNIYTMVTALVSILQSKNA